MDRFPSILPADWAKRDIVSILKIASRRRAHAHFPAQIHISFELCQFHFEFGVLAFEREDVRLQIKYQPHELAISRFFNDFPDLRQSSKWVDGHGSSCPPAFVRRSSSVPQNFSGQEYVANDKELRAGFLLVGRTAKGLETNNSAIITGW
jgi:hypothetical protein